MDPNTKSKSQLNIISVAFSAHNPIHNPFIIDGTVYKGLRPTVTKAPSLSLIPPENRLTPQHLQIRKYDTYKRLTGISNLSIACIIYSPGSSFRATELLVIKLQSDAPMVTGAVPSLSCHGAGRVLTIITYFSHGMMLTFIIMFNNKIHLRLFPNVSKMYCFFNKVEESAMPIF